MNDEQLRAFAEKLAHRYIIADGHVDLPDYLMKEKGFNVDTDDMNELISTSNGEFDFERAKKGGLDAPFMSIYIGKEYQPHPDHGKSLADSLIHTVKGIATKLPEKFALANTPDDVEKNFSEGKISLPMGMENGAPIGNDLKNLQYFFDQGIRYITLTHNQDNQICDSSRDTTRTWNGLSPFGIEVVKEMNRLGIMVDISHVDDSTFYQVMKLTQAPCIASHSSCRAISPTIMRDMTDGMIRKLGENGGVIMINFYNAFINPLLADYNKKLGDVLKEKGLTSSDSIGKKFIEEYSNLNPRPVTDLKIVADHIDHAVRIAGIDHVGLGSDYDGVDGMANLPVGLKDVSQYPNLIYELLKRGYSEEDIQKICSGNLFRVWRKTEEVASKMKN